MTALLHVQLYTQNQYAYQRRKNSFLSSFVAEKLPLSINPFDQTDLRSFYVSPPRTLTFFFKFEFLFILHDQY
jgi:hypothetical protein